MTHPIDEVRAYAAAGAGRYLWSIDRELTVLCVNMIAFEATLVQGKIDSEKSVNWLDRTPVEQIDFEAAEIVRERFFNEEGIPSNAYEQLDIVRHVGADANARILPICGNAPSEPISLLAFRRLAAVLVGWWDADDERASAV